MAPDPYAEADEIIDALTAEGLIAEASSLREVIAAGSTATEILMGMRWHLQKLDVAYVINLTTQRKLRQLLALLNEALS